MLSKGIRLGEVALYRKYRSATFDAVIGQPQVVQTLKNALQSGHLSHAYLFTGPRGVGKTSVARLLARAANCTAEDITARPCNECENCKTAIGSHLDLIEIDAASNRGIDDARALREKITSAPSMGRYKVYIIDEVHMLTTEAFNALLKTLEEPPAHAIFILATTEAHKLPETIISRTQRFTFRPILAADITAHLRKIADTETISIEDPALELIAQASRGGFRDAISLLDQVGHSGVSPLTEPAVRQLLGQSDPQLIERIAEGVASNEPAAVLAAVDEAVAQGVQATQLANQLIHYWRKQLQASVTDPSQRATVQRCVSSIEAVLPVLKSPWPELSLEAALVQLAVGAPIRTAPVKPVIQTVRATPAPSSEPEPTPIIVNTSDEQLWVKALTQIKQRNNSLYALLRSSVSVSFEGDTVLLGCRFSFHRDRLKEAKNLQVMEQALARVYGKKFKVVPQLEAKVSSPAAVDSSNELVSSALDILGGEVIE